MRYPRYIKLDEVLSKFWRRIAFEEGMSVQKLCSLVLYFAMDQWDNIEINVEELEKKYPNLRNQKPGRKPKKEENV